MGLETYLHCDSGMSGLIVADLASQVYRADETIWMWYEWTDGKFPGGTSAPVGQP